MEDITTKNKKFPIKSTGRSLIELDPYDLIKLREQGYSYRTIAQMYNVSDGTIRNHLKRFLFTKREKHTLN